MKKLKRKIDLLHVSCLFPPRTTQFGTYEGYAKSPRKDTPFKCPDCGHGINVSHRGCNLSKTEGDVHE